jgi:hypothetical protein
LKTQVYVSTLDTAEAHRIKKSASEKKKRRIFKGMQVSFFHAELTCVSVDMEVISSASCKKVKIKTLLIALLFVFFLYTTLQTQEVFKV